MSPAVLNVERTLAILSAVHIRMRNSTITQGEREIGRDGTIIGHELKNKNKNKKVFGTSGNRSKTAALSILLALISSALRPVTIAPCRPVTVTPTTHHRLRDA